MKKRVLLGFVLCVLASVLFATGSQETKTEDSASKQYIIKYAFTSPMDSQVGKIANGFKTRAEELSNGQIRVELYPDAQLGDKLENLESLRTGDLEMCDASASDMSGYNGRWSVFSFPYMWLNSREMLDICRDEKVYAMLDADMAKAGFKLITFADFGSRNPFLKSKGIYKPEDARGVKIRVMSDPILVKSMEAIGFSAISLGWSECYSALQQGTIDAIEQNEALCADNMLYEVASYYSYVSTFRIPGIQYMSKKFYDALPGHLQEVVLQAGRENEEDIYQWFPEYNNKAIEVLKKNGVVFNEVDDINAFVEKTKGIPDYYFGLKNTPADARNLYDAMMAARTRIRSNT